MYQKNTIYTFVGMGLYAIALLFLLYALNHPEGGLIYPFNRLTPILYNIYLIIMFAALLTGNVSSFKKYLNRTQLAGSIIFLTGIIFLVIFVITFMLIVSGKIHAGSGIFSMIWLLITAILPFPMFIIGSILISKE